MPTQPLRVVDTHTGGEPTRVIVSGGPDLGGGSMQERLHVFRDQFDHFRCALVNEPRGSDVMVGCLVVATEEDGADFGVIFFNNIGYLGMCGHGTIGVIVALMHENRIAQGPCRVATPVGPVATFAHDLNRVTIDNVISYRKHQDLCVDVEGYGQVLGDIAWGGNWFFLVKSVHESLTIDRIEHLTNLSQRIRSAVHAAGHPQVDHVELFGEPKQISSHSRNFVLCPGSAYDRSPCGTGTSAKLACLAADGLLAEKEIWNQESIIGSLLRGSYRWADRSQGHIAPQITGNAYVNAVSTIYFDNHDPFAWGIPQRSE